MVKGFTLSLRLLCLFVCSFISLSTITAQTNTNIGTGATGNSTTGYPCPLQDYYEGTRSQFLYRASELAAAGMGPGNIEGIKFNVTALNGAGVIEQYTISIGGTSVATLSGSSWEPGTTTVFGPIDYQPVTGLNTFTFNTPFFWNGSDNIIIEVCNGDPNTTSGTFWTNNPTVPWTTGLSFNGSHSYREDNVDNLCGTTTTTEDGTPTTRPNITFTWSAAAACTGTPLGGSAVSSIGAVCNSTTPFTVSVSGSSPVSGLTYQWQSSLNGTTYGNITGATGNTYSSTGISVNTYYQRITYCGANGSTSTPVLVTTNNPTYATLPFTESFENSWLSICGVDEAPNNSWRGSPVSGETSWRRNDDGTSAGWTGTAGAYTPASSDGSYSARFHSYFATAGTKGQLNLYLNCNTAANNKILSYDFINTSGTDTLSILISTNGGTTFTRIDSARLSAAWRTKTVQFVSTSATTVIRFEATGDFGATDIGLDNVSVVDYPNCSGTPTGGTTTSTTTSVCSTTTPFTLNVTGATTAAGLTYQWLSSTNGTSYSNIPGATGATYTSTGITVPTYFQRQIICSGSSSLSTPILVGFSTIVYANIPYVESFESVWVSNCNTHEIPNQFWRSTPVTGNNSWRRNDDGASAAWSSNTGGYTPTASVGTYSARFHSYDATSGTTGKLDLYINCNTPATNKQLTFDQINISGTDKLKVYLSTDAGSTFNLIGTYDTAAAWRTRTIFFNSTSATSVIRFEGTSDFGFSDIGIDNINVLDWADCSGTPAGGTASSTTTNACVAPFTLSVTGVTSGNGITYQWQSSTDGGTTWNNITGATGFSLTTTQVGTTLYRLQVTCSFSGLAGYSTTVQVISPVPLNGNYTIDNSKPTAGINFNSFNDAYNAIKCGINGPVLFDVYPGNGTYNEQLIMTQVPGTSPTFTVTFRGHNGASIGFAASSSTSRAVIKLNNASYIQFDSLTINANSGTYGYGVQLINDADFNVVSNCTINSSTTVNTTNFAGIVINGTDAGPVSTGVVLCDNNSFVSNQITGGYYGITLAASFAGGASGNNVFSKNLVTDFFQTGMYVAGAYNTIIDGNTFTRPTRTAVTDFNGILFTTEKNTGNFVTGNKIGNGFGGALTSTGTFNGINFTNSKGSPGAENFVYNNVIYSINGAGAAYGIINTASDYVYYLHNTISLDDQTSTSTLATRGFYQTGAASQILFYDNVVSVTRTGAGAKNCIYLGSLLLTGADNNDYYISSSAGTAGIGFYTTNRVTLLDWKGATGLDAASISVLPAFVDPANGNYAPGNAAMDNKGLYLGIDTDILGNPRDQNTPDIGAYEFTPPACTIPPVNGATYINTVTICENNPVFMTLNIGPFGSGQTFQWQYSTTAGGTYTNLGNALSTPDTTIMSYRTYYYRVEVACGSTKVYSNPVLLNVNLALPSGTYTIDKGNPTNYVPGVPGGNFNSFADAKASMGCGIVGGPITFNVVPNSGPYTEQVKLDSIAGTSATRTITFNGNGNTLKFASASSTERAVIKLNAADYIVFDSLTIDATGGTYGYGVQLINNADSNVVRKCTIIATATSTNYAGVVLNATDAGLTAFGNTLCDGNIFDKNTITGGYYSFSVVGSNTAANYINNNSFTNNTLKDFYTAGFYVAGTSGTKIDGNTLSRPTLLGSPSLVYGIQLANTPNSKLVINANRFTNFLGGTPTATTTTVYGVYHNNINATPGNETVVSNNLFYKLTGNGPLYALYNSASANVNYYHNTIALDNSASTATGQSAGFYQTGTATGIDFRNNLITIQRGGTGAKFGIYMATTASDVVSNNNNFYLTANNSYVGFYGANAQTLATWQGLSGKDLNSLTLNPLYADSVNDNYKPQLSPLDNKGAPVGIGNDIVKLGRSSTTPDIGAYEFSPNPCSIPLLAGTATVTPNSALCLDVPIQLNVNSSSPLGTLTFTWQGSPDGTTGWTDISAPQYFPLFNTLSSTSNYYRAMVSCGTGSPSYTNVVSVGLNSLLAGGTYTIGGSGANNFATFNAAVTAMLCGITGPVVFNVQPGTYSEQVLIPYIPGTSSVNNVIFQSANGQASSVTLTNNATVATSNYTLKLDSTFNFTFRNIGIAATNTTNARVVEMARGASFDLFDGCAITGPTVTSTANTTAAFYSATTKGRGNMLKGNTVKNGSTGIYIAGTGTAAGLAPRIVLDSNTISGTYNYGIFATYLKNSQLTRNQVTMAAPLNATSYGMYVFECDSAVQVKNNKVTVTNTTTTVYGINVTNCDSSVTQQTSIMNNVVTAITSNTGGLYGLYVANSPGNMVANNAVSVGTSSATAYGLYNTSTNHEKYYNNSINNASTGALTATTDIAAYFATGAATDITLRNNIFSHTGGGKALYVANTSQAYASDYNMLYTSGANLAQSGTPAGTYANLVAWKNGVYWDINSIGYQPAFVSTSTLQPDVTNPNAWAMNGRGIQIQGNNVDINGNARATTLTTGVPDLGAYEFVPTALPTSLTATPAVPAPNTTQTYMYGTDTVMKVKWGATAPPSAIGRRYSGVVPSNLPAGMDSMYFYTQVEIPGGGNYDYDMQLFYLDPWQGSIPDQYNLGLGRTTAANSWIVGFSSRVDVPKHVITQTNVSYIDKFTGLVNPYAPPIVPDKDSSNRGRRFWVGYQMSYDMVNGGNAQEMVLYLSTNSQAANVQVKVNGTTWFRNYIIPPNTTVSTQTIPKTGADDATMTTEGKFSRGISITADVPITAYAHIYSSANSGATMLFPVGVWGYEYYTLNNRQNYSPTGSYNAIVVISDNDNTVVEITPSNPTLNGKPAGVPFTVTLNKGEEYQVLGGMIGGDEGYDLTGSSVKSVANSSGKCYPIAVFSGTTRTGLGCGGSAGSSGDLSIAQVFPYQAWGKHYLTAPTSNANGPSASTLMTNIYRVLVKDPTAVVKRNNNTLTGIINGRYYEYESGQADEITSDKPIMVSQYMSSSADCPNTSGDGDPDNFFISPVEQGVNYAGFYRNNLYAINENYLTLTIPTAGVSSLKIDGVLFSAIPAAQKYSYVHPFNPAYTICIKKWPAGAGQSTVQSDSAFTGTVYGLGSVESYGYNVGTLVKNLQGLGQINNTLNPSANKSDFTCTNTPFRFTALLPIVPTKLTWKFGGVPGLNFYASGVKAPDTTITNPVSTSTTVVNGVVYNTFPLNLDYTFTTPGLYPIQIQYQHPDIEGCDHTGQDIIYVQVLPSPKNGFTISFSGCVGDMATFTGDAVTQNGVNVNQWIWTFHDNTTVSNQSATYTYNTPGTYLETMRSITSDGCVGDSTRPVVVSPKPIADVVTDSIAVCSGTTATFDVLNPASGVTYNWYTTPTGGSPVATGTSFTTPPVTGKTVYYVEAVGGTSCISLTRKRVVADIQQTLPAISATVASVGANSITFSWNTVAGAVSYNVIASGGTLLANVAAPTTTYTVSGLGTLESVTVTIQAVGSNPCQSSTSAPVSACTDSPADVVSNQVSSCQGAIATLCVNNPEPGITYNWFDAATGGTLLGTGSCFTVSSVTIGADYYVEQSSTSCTSSTRTKVSIIVSSPLTPAVVTVTNASANSVTFSWGAVPGAVSYDVTINGTTIVNNATSPYTITGLGTLQSASVVVTANGSNPCEISSSSPVSGCSNSAAAVVNSDIKVCFGSSATFDIQSPESGITYSWYTAPTGGTLVATGTSFTVTNVIAAGIYYVEQSSASCTSTTRTMVTVAPIQSLAQANVTVTASTTNSVSFSWTAVTGAVSYDIYINGSLIQAGVTATTYTVTGLGTLQSASIVVKANGNSSCETSTSTLVSGCSNSSANVVSSNVSACNGTQVTFTIQSPEAGITYNWYSAATGGTLLGTGITFTTPVSTTTDFYVEQSSSSCTSTTRTKVTATIFQILTAPVVTATSSTANSVTFGWNAVPGAAGYEVSSDNGATWTPVGLVTTYTVTGLTTMQSATLLVRVNGQLPCQTAISSPAPGCATSLVQVVQSSQTVCSGDAVTFTVQSPVTGITYNWYSVATGGTPVASNTSTFTASNVTAGATYYVEQSNSSCTSARTPVTVSIYTALATPLASVDEEGADFVRFKWNAVSGAVAYKVSVNGGAWIDPSSGTTGLTHQVNGLAPFQEVTLAVQAIAANSCQNSISSAVSGKAVTHEDVFIPNSFTPNGDGLNDVLLVYGKLVEMRFTVFNQWGQKIFDSKDQGKGWDGRFDGKAQPSGVYLYVGRFVMRDGSVVEKKGSINLMR